jgi:hypothetical protein
MEDLVEAPRGIWPIPCHVKDPQPGLSKRAKDAPGTRTVVVRGAGAVLEEDDRAVARQRLRGSPQNLELGAIYIHLDKVWDVVRRKGIVEPFRPYNEIFGLPWPRVTTAAQAAEAGLSGDVREGGGARAIGQSGLPNVHLWELIREAPRERRERLEGHVSTLRRQPDHRPQQLPVRRPDIYAVRVPRECERQ